MGFGKWADDLLEPFDGPATAGNPRASEEVFLEGGGFGLRFRGFSSGAVVALDDAELSWTNRMLAFSFGYSLGSIVTRFWGGNCWVIQCNCIIAVALGFHFCFSPIIHICKQFPSYNHFSQCIPLNLEMLLIWSSWWSNWRRSWGVDCSWRSGEDRRSRQIIQIWERHFAEKETWDVELRYLAEWDMNWRSSIFLRLVPYFLQSLRKFVRRYLNFTINNISS